MRTEPDEICFNKGAVIERAIRRIHEEFAANPDLDNYTHVDAMILNIERACQAAIDMAMHLVAQRHLGMPQSSAGAFRLLANAGIISGGTLRSMAAMTAFRNIAIHEYQELDVSILREVAQKHWHSLVQFCLELGIRINP